MGRKSNNPGLTNSWPFTTKDHAPCGANEHVVPSSLVQGWLICVKCRDRVLKVQVKSTGITAYFIARQDWQLSGCAAKHGASIPEGLVSMIEDMGFEFITSNSGDEVTLGAEKNGG